MPPNTNFTIYNLQPVSAFLNGEFGPGVASLLASRDWGQEEEDLGRRGDMREALLRAELERIVGGEEVRNKGDYPFIASLKVKVGSQSGARK